MTAESSIWTLSGLILAAAGVAFVGILFFAERLIPGLGTVRGTAPDWVALAVVLLGAAMVVAGVSMTMVGRNG